MPKAAVYEDYAFASRKDEVWRSRKAPDMKSVTIAKTEDQLSNHYLRLCIGAADSPHILRTLVCCEPVHNLFDEENLSRCALNGDLLQEMTILLPLRLAETHGDYELLNRLEQAIYRHAGGPAKFAADIPKLLRQAIDEVIDPARSKRFTMQEIEKTEKTYLGTKIEILLRNHLGLDRGGPGQLDVLIDGIQVDVKNTVGTAWTIPNEALGHPCILISSDEEKATCSFGLIVIRAEVLNSGKNRDQKTTIKKSELVNVHWLLRNAPYPPNFWLGLDPEVRRAIVSPRGGTNRLAMLFRLYQGKPISRQLIEALAQQKDPMKRVRKNGGARDKLAQEGIIILSGKTQAEQIAQYGLPYCTPDEFISIAT